MKYILIFFLFVGTAQGQSITDLLNAGNIEAIENAEAQINGDLQTQITYNKVLIDSLYSEIKKLKKTEVVEESQELKKFKYFLSQGKDYLYIYKKFSKNDLKAIAQEVGASTSGIKKTIALAIQNKLQ